jgi:hypothetical protein
MDSSVVVCVDQTANPTAVSGAPCPLGQGLMVVQAQLFAPGDSFDPLQASGFYFFGFGVIVFAWLVGFAVGQVRKPIRQGH